MTFPVADAPAKPSAPLWKASDKTSVTVSWTKQADTQVPAGAITGHYLYMDNGNTGDFALVFSGAGNPEVVEYKVTGSSIVTGRRYRFYLSAENHVGLSV